VLYHTTPYLHDKMASYDAVSLVSIVTYSGVAPHWGLFLVNPEHKFTADPDNVPTGKLWEVVVNNNVNTRSGLGVKAKAALRMLFPRHDAKKHYQCRRWENFDLGRSARSSIVSDFHVYSTERRIDAAVECVMEKFRYGFFKENCQMFVLEVLQVLSDWDSDMVPREHVEWVKKHAAVMTVRHIPFKTGKKERPRFTDMANEEEDRREAEARSRRVQNSGSTDVFNPNIAVLPRDDGVRGGMRSRTQTREKSSSAGNGFNSMAVLPLDTGAREGRRVRTDTRQSTQRAPLVARTLKKGGGSDPTPARKIPGAWDGAWD
jgi:hypothetical protein